MSAIWLVLPLAMVFAAIAVGAFIWTVKSGQFDDLDTPAIRPLVDDAEDHKPPNHLTQQLSAYPDRDPG